MSKITQYPDELDSSTTLPDISETARMNEPGLEHDVQHTLLNQAVIELEKKVGTNASDDENSLEFRVKYIEENGSGGAGLVLGPADTVTRDPDTTITLPATPSAWLLVSIAGVEYVVPGYKVAQLEAPHSITGDAARLYNNNQQIAHRYQMLTQDAGIEPLYNLVAHAYYALEN